MVFKAAFISQLLKKPYIDPTDVKSYTDLSRTCWCCRNYLKGSAAYRLLRPDFYQSDSQRTGLIIQRDGSAQSAMWNLWAIDSSDLAILTLTLLDLSAAFDTVDYAMLLRRHDVSYGLGGAVFSLFESYLEGRTQFVRCGSKRSRFTRVGYNKDRFMVWSCFFYTRQIYYDR